MLGGAGFLNHQQDHPEMAVVLVQKLGRILLFGVIKMYLVARKLVSIVFFLLVSWAINCY